TPGKGHFQILAVAVLITTGLGRLVIALQIQVHSALVDPVVVVRAEEVDWKVADTVVQVQHIFWNNIRVANAGRPPAVAAKLDPDDVAVVQLLTLNAAAAVEALVVVERVLQTFVVKGRGT